MAFEGETIRVGEEIRNEEETGENAEGRRRSTWPTQSQLRVAVLKLTRDLEEVRSGPGFYDRVLAERMLRDYIQDLEALTARRLAKDPDGNRMRNVMKRTERYRTQLEKMRRADGVILLNREERTVLKSMLEDYTRALESFVEEDRGGENDLEAAMDEVQAYVDMVDQGIPLELTKMRFEVLAECLSASLAGVEGEFAECSRLRSSGSIEVYEFQLGFVIDALVSRNVHDRVRRYKETLELSQEVALGEYDASDRQRLFTSVAFCVEALWDLARQLQSVVHLLNMCCRKDWWITALELSDTLPRTARWSRFLLATRACEWSIEVVELGFQALRQFLQGDTPLHGVDFKWCEDKSAMALLIDGKQLYEEETEDERPRRRMRARTVARGRAPYFKTILMERHTRVLEENDATALLTKLTELKTLDSPAEATMHAIADYVSQKLDGPIPESNFLPWTHRINPSTLTYVQYLASGTSGMVAKFSWLGQQVCVKSVKSSSKRRFEEEAAVLATAQHPRVVRMIGCTYHEASDTGSLVMELMEQNLRTVIEMRCPDPGPGVSPFPVLVAVDIALQIGEAMLYLHKLCEILHRGLQGKSILVNRARRVRRTVTGAYRKFPDLASLLHPEDQYVAKLADFGIATAQGTQQSHAWRAPEVFNDEYQRPADVYSFAMTCYEILTGRVPFEDVDSSEIYERIVAGVRPSLEEYRLPAILKDLLQRCWATDPEERPNFAEICKSLWHCKVECILPEFRRQLGCEVPPENTSSPFIVN